MLACIILLPESIANVVQFMALSYGYTLAIWASGGLAALRYGTPNPKDVLLFITGAICSYISVTLIVLSQVPPTSTFVDFRVPFISVINGFSLASAIATSMAAREIRNKEAGYFATGFTSTLVYILSLSFFLDFYLQYQDVT